MDENLKIKMMIKAVLKHPRKKIEPCDNKRFDECFTEYKNKVVFWYNVENNPHVIIEML